MLKQKLEEEPLGFRLKKGGRTNRTAPDPGAAI
jgi:hypothetical protein